MQALRAGGLQRPPAAPQPNHTGMVCRYLHWPAWPHCSYMTSDTTMQGLMAVPCITGQVGLPRGRRWARMKGAGGARALNAASRPACSWPKSSWAVRLRPT